MRPLIRFAPAAAVALALAAPAAAQAAVPGSPYSTAVLNDHPSAYYGLDETSGTTATDASPNHADGQYNGAVTLGAAAPFTPDAGTAVTLDKTETVTSTLGSGAGSAELWVKLNSTGGQTIVSQGDPATTGWSLGIGKTGSQKRKLIFTTGGKVTNSKLGMVANLWTQVLVAVDGSKIRFSTNGGSQLKSVTRQGSAPSPGSGSTLTIGSSTFAGSVDEVVVYPTALSQAEFKTHFGLTSYPLSTGAPAVSGPNNPPHIGDVLTATTGTWTSATQPLTYSYQWQRCDDTNGCSDIAGATTSSYTVTSTDVHSALGVVVTATNPAGNSTDAASNLTGVVGYVPPVNSGQPTVSGNAVDGQTLTTDNGSWTGGDAPVTYTYQWQRCDNLGANCLDVDGATDSSYVLSAADVGSTLQAIVTAVNPAETYPTATSTLSGVVASVPPSETGAPSVSGAAVDGGALTADPGTWGGTQPLDYSYQWQECDGVTCSDVLGATGDTYDLSAGDIGHTLQVVVTAANHFGEHASATSSPSDVVAAVAPSNTTAPVLSGLAQEGGTLTVAPGLWTGTVPVDFTYQWQHCDAGGTNCVDVVGATGSSYLVTSADRGATLLAIVKATNVGGSQSVPTAPSAVVPTPSSGGSGGGTGGSGSGGGTTGGTTGTTTGTTAGTTGTTGTTSGSHVCRMTVLPKPKKLKFGKKLVTVRVTAAKLKVAPFKVTLKARKGVVKSVKYTLDGKKLRSTRKAPLVAKIAKALKSGTHTVRVKVTPKHGKARTVTLRFQLGGC